MTKKATPSLRDIRNLASNYHKGVKASSKSFHGTYGGGIKDLTKSLVKSRKKTSTKSKRVRSKNSLKF